MTLRIVKSGSWQYDDVVNQPVDILGLDYDFWYELNKADGLLEPGEEATPLSAEGLLYYVRFRCAGEPAEPTWVDSIGRDTIEDAVRDAEEKLSVPIAWDVGV